MRLSCKGSWCEPLPTSRDMPLHLDFLANKNTHINAYRKCYWGEFITCYFSALFILFFYQLSFVTRSLGGTASFSRPTCTVLVMHLTGISKTGQHQSTWIFLIVLQPLLYNIKKAAIISSDIKHKTRGIKLEKDLFLMLIVLHLFFPSSLIPKSHWVFPLDFEHSLSWSSLPSSHTRSKIRMMEPYQLRQNYYPVVDTLSSSPGAVFWGSALLKPHHKGSYLLGKIF